MYHGFMNFCHNFLLYRVKKLEDTLTAVQQLESDTNDLRQWLSKVERELNTPITYTSCNLVEIQAKLKVQQVLPCYQNRLDEF